MSKLLLYCTNKKLSLRKSIKDKDYYLDNGSKFNIIPKEDYVLNGKIVAECDFEVENIEYKHIHERDQFSILHNDSWYEYKGTNVTHYNCNLASRSGFEDSGKLFDYLFDYLVCKDGYAINIKNLHIFDNPKELDEVYYKSVYSWGITYEIGYHRMHKAPKNIRYVYDKEGKEKKIIITVSPEEMCRIANKEQTALIRKVVLKEML